MSDEVRVVHLTPHGSGCSVVIGKGSLSCLPARRQRIAAVRQPSGVAKLLPAECSRPESAPPWATLALIDRTLPCTTDRGGCSE